jgi:hypothetical protein
MSITSESENVHHAERDELPQAVRVRRDARIRLPVFLREKNARLDRWILRVQLGPEVARHQLA